jgi:hypothetical protein
MVVSSLTGFERVRCEPTGGCLLVLTLGAESDEQSLLLLGAAAWLLRKSCCY